MGRSADLPRHAGSGDRGRDDTGCAVLHVDMDAFYASVELLERPELVGRPVIVAGGSTRGVVLSATYEARAYGVRSAMPAAAARRLCPQARFIPPRMPRYAEVSRAVLELFRSITPLVEPLSLDEAFLDVSGALRRLGMTPAVVGEWVRAQVFDAHGLTCSVGVASSKFIAKIASSMAKPDGMLVVPADRVLEFLHPLPVSALWGVGPRTAERLHGLACRTVGDVAATPQSALRRAVGTAAADHLLTLARGHDPRHVDPDVAEKSVGAEETFDEDVSDVAVLRRELLRLSERTAATLRNKRLRGRTVVIKLRYADFTTVTRSRTLADPSDTGSVIFATAADLLAENLPRGARIRLVGVRAEQLVSEHAAEQLTLDGGDHGWSDLDRAADMARSRFGSAALRPATLLGSATRSDRSGPFG